MLRGPGLPVFALVAVIQIYKVLSKYTFIFFSFCIIEEDQKLLLRLPLPEAGDDAVIVEAGDNIDFPVDDSNTGTDTIRILLLRRINPTNIFLLFLAGL